MTSAWINYIKIKYPELYRELSDLGITDDNNYLISRTQLKTDILTRIDVIRYNYLRSLIDSSDPFQKLQIAPLDFLQTRIQDCNFTVRIQNILARRKVETLEDLARYNLRQAMRFRDFGIKSSADMLKRIDLMLENYMEFIYSNSGSPIIAKEDDYHVLHNRYADWIIALDHYGQHYKEKLDKLSIFSDEDYLNKRHLLDSQMQEQIDFYRLRALFNSSNKPDLKQLLQMAPESYLNIDIDNIDIPERLRTAFKRNDIRSLADLLRSGINKLKRWKNVGQNSVMQLTKLIYDDLENRVKQNENQDKSENAGSNNKDLFYTLQQILEESLTVQQRFVFISRMGFGVEVNTLEELGKKLDVTRERVRQLEAKAILKLSRKINWHADLVIRILNLLNNRHHPLYLESLIFEDIFFLGFLNETKALSNLINRFGEGSVKCFEVGEKSVIARIGKEEWSKLIRNMRRFLDGQSTNNLSRVDVENIVWSSLFDKKASELSDLMIDIL